MCGIFGYVGEKEAAPILIEGLSSLEYRGYDSSGICVSGSGCVKAAGPLANLKKKLPADMKGQSGIAHLRWATHGEPNERNAHPHSDCTKNIWVVHNGIIENYADLKKDLIAQGHAFISDTDTEVIAHLVEENYKEAKDFTKAFMQTLAALRGTYGITAFSEYEPGTVLAARMGAPVVLGLGEGENFVASDASPLLRHTRQVLYLRDGEVAILKAGGHSVVTIENQQVHRDPEQIDWTVEEIQKGAYPHYMLKEIMEGPEVIINTTRGRLLPEDGLVKLGGLEQVAEQMRNIKRIIIVGCGTAYYAGLVGEYMLEEYAGIPVEVEVGSEFRYRKPIIDEHTMLLAISQSGETADTLEAIREAKRKGALTIGIVNAVGSTIARETDAGIYNHAGPEIGVASTKAFISQLTALALLSVFLGRQRQMSLSTGKRITEELSALPEKLASILARSEEIGSFARQYAATRDFLYIGRKYNYPVAYEGALKLKEVSYIHAEGYGAGEMKHGPLAMIDKEFPTFAIALSDSVYEKMISNMQEIRARRGPILAVATQGDEKISELTDDVIYIPKTLEMLSPILSVVPLQLFAYHMAVARGLNVDQPRNLAKSVTVE